MAQGISISVKKIQSKGGSVRKPPLSSVTLKLFLLEQFMSIWNKLEKSWVRSLCEPGEQIFVTRFISFGFQPHQENKKLALPKCLPLDYSCADRDAGFGTKMEQSFKLMLSESVIHYSNVLDISSSDFNWPAPFGWYSAQSIQAVKGISQRPSSCVKY